MNPKNLPENSIVITDTSCFVLLGKIKALHILQQLFTTVLTTPEIADEYGSALPDWIDQTSRPIFKRKISGVR